MPKVKSAVIETSLGNGLGRAQENVTYNVNTSGEFYCQLPENLLTFFELNKCYSGGVTCKKNKAKKLAIYCSTLAGLEGILREALCAINKPTVTTEHVILYNIESHVSFAETPEGEICPNAGYPNAKWPLLNSSTAKMYGDHHASQCASGGYSLCIGAKAFTKITYRVGEKVAVEYKRYYKEESNHGHSNPAQKLNSWTSFSLPDHAKEIPYTDEAALFFHNLMMGMAKLSKQIQEATFDQPSLLALIESSSGNLLGPPREQLSTDKSLNQ